ncbi:unnamed protein product [Closterium sp. NIES-65]|nr:unnamed protein product [Closterium sp. NIES-65]
MLSHTTAQQALVEIGDKDAAFVGSSQWIGEIELSFILDHPLRLFPHFHPPSRACSPSPHAPRCIQEALVEIGDKDAAFVGSSQWIGAIELSFILDHLLGVRLGVLGCVNELLGAGLWE